MEVLEYLFFVLPVLYLAVTVAAYKFKWRWPCALMILAICLTFIFLLGVQNAFAVGGSMRTLFQHNSPIWGYLLLMAIAAASSKVRVTNALMGVAHILLVIGVFAWGLKPETWVLGVLFLLGAPIWLGLRLSKPRPVSIPSSEGVTLGR